MTNEVDRMQMLTEIVNIAPIELAPVRGHLVLSLCRSWRR